MVQVPYKPYPSVPALEIARVGNRIDVHTPEAAFGGAVAAGLDKLGASEERVGGELFQRAIALQELRNNTEARDANSQYIMQQGQLQANYDSLTGKAKVDALTDHIQQSNELRMNIRESLSNDAARKIYDGESMGFMARNVYSSAGQAASANKTWHLQSNAAALSAAKNQAGRDPFDDEGFDKSVQMVSDHIQDEIAMGRLDAGPIADAERSKRVSELWQERLRGMAQQSPFQSKVVADAAIRDGKIRGEDIYKTQQLVRSQLYNAGARNIANDVHTGRNINYGAGPVPMERAMDAISHVESGGSYDAITDSKTKLGRALGKYQVMEGELQDQLRQAGLPAMTPAAFLKDHAAQDRLFSTVFGGLMQKYGNFNDAASVWFSGKPVAEAGNRKDVLGTTVPMYLQMTNAQLAKNSSLAEKVERGRGMAGQLAPDEPLLQDYVTQHIESDNNRQQAIKRDTDFTNKQTIEGALMGGTTGKIPTTIDELKADPKTEAAWEALEPSEQRKYLEHMSKADRGNIAWTGDGLKRWWGLKGMAANDPAKFLDQDIFSESLPISAKRELLNLQAKIKQAPGQDPRLPRALSQLRPMLDASGISRTKDADGYDHFTGVLQDALEDFQQKNKRPPNYQELQEMGTRLLQQQTIPGWLWNSSAPLYNLEVPDRVSEEIKADPAWAKIGITPNDEQIRRIYVMQQYQKLYGGAKGE